MAVEIGTATDHIDLYNKLFSFLTTNPDLVAADQQWERVTTVGNPPPLTAAHSGADDGITGAVMLKGKGNAGQDEIYVSLYLYDNTSNNTQMCYMMGHTGVLASNQTYQNHVNSSVRTGFLVWTQPMEYWFIANGRRFMGVVKCGTVYESFYAGLYLPYTFPEGNPYPLMIGGTTGVSTGNTSLSDTSENHRSFVDPAYDDGYQLAAVAPSGDWVNFYNWNSSSYDNSSRNTFPYGSAIHPRDLDIAYLSSYPYTSSDRFEVLQDGFVNPQKPLLGGGYMLTPVTLMVSSYHDSSQAAGGVWGIMDGVHHVTGYDNSAENIVQENGVDHLVVQNIYRTSPNSYFTMALE